MQILSALLQHIATLLRTTCRIRLVTLLQHAAWFWLKFENGQSFLATFLGVVRCTRLATFVQHFCPGACALVWFNCAIQHVTYCNRVAKRVKKHVVHNNISRCCVEMLRPFSQLFHNILQHDPMLPCNIALVWPGLYM